MIPFFVRTGDRIISCSEAKWIVSQLQLTLRLWLSLTSFGHPSLKAGSFIPTDAPVASVRNPMHLYTTEVATTLRLYDNRLCDNLSSVIKREHSMKFLGVILDENVTWKEHKKLIENQTAKNIGILYKAKFLKSKLPNKYLLFLYTLLLKLRKHFLVQHQSHKIDETF